MPPSDRRGRPAPAAAGFSAAGGRTALGYWVPLAVTVTVATVGLAAWVWSERSDSDHSDEEEDEWEDDHDRRRHDYDDDRRRRHRRRGGQGEDEPIHLDARSEGAVRATGVQPQPQPQPEPEADPDEPGVVARMQGAMRRSPSPKQFWDDASKRVVAGVSAAGTAVGGALTSIREERNGNGDFEEHSRWAEPPGPVVDDHPSNPRSGGTQFTMSGALAPAAQRSSPSTRKRRSVAIVVSSVSAPGEPGDAEGHMLEHTVRSSS